MPSPPAVLALVLVLALALALLLLACWPHWPHVHLPTLGGDHRGRPCQSEPREALLRPALPPRTSWRRRCLDVLLLAAAHLLLLELLELRRARLILMIFALCSKRRSLPP